jgi:hypothetical protein
VIRLDDRDGDAWLLADDKAARGDENGLILMVGVEEEHLGNLLLERLAGSGTRDCHHQ